MVCKIVVLKIEILDYRGSEMIKNYVTLFKEEP